MLHRLREAMKRDDGFTCAYDGDDRRGRGLHRWARHAGSTGHCGPKIEHTTPDKAVVFTLINAESGEARSRVVPNVKGDTLRPGDSSTR